MLVGFWVCLLTPTIFNVLAAGKGMQWGKRLQRKAQEASSCAFRSMETVLTTAQLILVLKLCWWTTWSPQCSTPLPRRSESSK